MNDRLWYWLSIAAGVFGLICGLAWGYIIWGGA